MGKYIQRSGRCSLAQAAVQAVSDLLINELFDDGNWYAYEWPEGMSYVSLPLGAEVIFHLDSTTSTRTRTRTVQYGTEEMMIASKQAAAGLYSYEYCTVGSRIREGGSLVGPRVPTMTRYCTRTKYCTCAKRACTVRVRVLDENEKKRGSSAIMETRPSISINAHIARVAQLTWAVYDALPNGIMYNP